MRFFLDAHPGLLLWLLVAALVSVAAAGLLARRHGLPLVPTALLLAAVLLPLALTLTPSLGVGGSGRPSCTTELRPYGWWGTGGEELANALLLVPLGLLATWFLGRRSAPVLVLGACLPVAVEGTQYLLPWLGRSCDVLDLALNGAGLVAGAAVGAVLRRLTRAAPAPSSSPAPPARSGARSR